MAIASLEASDELGALLEKSSSDVAGAILQLVEAKAKRSRRKIEAALSDLGSVVTASMGMADLLGRRRLILDIENRIGRRGVRYGRNFPQRYADPANEKTPIIPRVPFWTAIEDFKTRYPALGKSAEEVRQLYAEGHAFAMAKSLDIEVTKRMQKEIERIKRAGLPADKAAEEMEKVRTAAPQFFRDWSVAYAQTVFRTNVTGAYTAGRFRQAMDPDLDEFAVGFIFSTAQDPDVRKNHRPLHGMIAHKMDPVWDRFSPPLGYN